MAIQSVEDACTTLEQLLVEEFGGQVSQVATFI